MMATVLYAQVLAKIGAERGRLFGEAKLEKLAEAKDLPELVSMTRETIYKQQIASFSSPYTSRKLERAFKENLIESYGKIIKYSPKRVAPFLKTFLVRIEIENLKTLVKALAAGLSVEDKQSRIFLQAESHLKRKAVFEEAARATDLKQLLGTFKKTDYESPLNLGLKRYEETGSTMAVDVLLDKEYYEMLYAAFRRLPKAERKHASFYTKTKIDGFTLLTLLRGKVMGYSTQWLRQILPEGHFKLSKDQLEKVIIALDFGSALNAVMKTEYAEYFAKNQAPEETIATAQKAFRTSILNHANKTQITDFFSIAAPLGFMIQKETEVANLTAISVGVEAALKVEEILAALLLHD